MTTEMKTHSQEPAALTGWIAATQDWTSGRRIARDALAPPRRSHHHRATRRRGLEPCAGAAPSWRQDWVQLAEQNLSSWTPKIRQSYPNSRRHSQYMLPAYSRCQASSLAPQTRMEVLRMRKNPSQSAVENNVHGDARIRSCGANVAQAGDAGEKGRILTKYSVQAVPACSAQRNFGRKNVRPNRMEKIPRDFWLVGCQICDSELPSGVH